MLLLSFLFLKIEIVLLFVRQFYNYPTCLVDLPRYRLSKNYYLIKNFKFKNFEESLNFTNKVGEIAEQENHHPDISFGWGYCKIKIFTHAIKGLAESDFILAAKIDKLD